MRIAQIAPIAERVPPKKYGGTERVIATLTDELVDRGHDVTLFASGDSVTKAKLVSVFPRATREAGIKDPHGINEWSIHSIANAYKQQEKFDIVHDHNLPISTLAANFAKVPVVATLHGSLSFASKKVYSTLSNVNLITISESQKRQGHGLNIYETVHHGLNFDNYPIGESSENFLLFVGRISFDKGLHHAIEIAQFLNIKLVIAAKLDQTDKKYFAEYIEPSLSDGLIEWVGEVSETERNQLYSKALCLINPITWPEPFGLTMIEAMACGCPVVAFNQGSVPEIVVPGATGFIANDIEEMIESILEVARIDRRETALYARANFNSQTMTDKYERIYQQILANQNTNTFQSNIAPTQLDLLLETRPFYRQKPRN